MLLSFRESLWRPVLTLVLLHFVQEVARHDVEGGEHFRALPDKTIIVKIGNAIGYDPALEVEDTLGKGVLRFHKFIVLVELPGEVGGIDAAITVTSDKERILSELWPLSKELADKGNGVKRELVVVCSIVNTSLCPRVPDSGWVVD